MSVEPPEDGNGPRVAVDRARCCASGNCARLVPEVFDQDEEDGLVRLRSRAPVPGRLRAAVREAAELCPTAAIRLAGGPGDAAGPAGVHDGMGAD